MLRCSQLYNAWLTSNVPPPPPNFSLLHHKGLSKSPHALLPPPPTPPNTHTHWFQPCERARGCFIVWVWHTHLLLRDIRVSRGGGGGGGELHAHSYNLQPVARRLIISNLLRNTIPPPPPLSPAFTITSHRTPYHALQTLLRLMPSAELCKTG